MAAAVGEVWRPQSLEGPFAAAEAVAAEDLNNLYRTSTYFTDPERYRSFCAFYAIMRIVDDRIDDIVARRRVPDAVIVREARALSAWRNAVSGCLARQQAEGIELQELDHPYSADLIATFVSASSLFPAPAGLWEAFFDSMQRDLDRRRFDTFDDFVEYAQGASGAPTSIYLYLITAERSDGRSTYHPLPGFELIECGRDLGLFAYLAHVLRDLAQDLAVGDRGLLYLAADDMAAHGISEETLFTDLGRRRSSPRLRSLVGELVARAREHARRGRARIRVLDGRLDPDRRFVLELIVRVYEGVLDKIEACSFDVLSGRHRLSVVEKAEIASHLAADLAHRLA